MVYCQNAKIKYHSCSAGLHNPAILQLNRMWLVITFHTSADYLVELVIMLAWGSKQWCSQSLMGDVGKPSMQEEWH